MKGMPARLVKLVALAALICITCAEEGAQYLQNTIDGLRGNMDFVNTRGSPQIIQVTPPAPIDRAYTQESVPSLYLTKAELAALYQSAVQKGETIKLDPADGGTHPINAAVHQLDSTASNTKISSDKDSGYYYYYYPLKSFMDELSSGYQHEDVKLEQYHHEKPHHHPHLQHHHHNKHHDDTKSLVHSHTHQHNVHIEPIKNMMDMDKKGKGLEPLFMAISGFIGMTIMFILSILVLPKFDKLKPKNFKSGSEMTSITRIAIDAVEGKDCAERLACEAGKAAKAFNLYDNRFVKLVRRMAPMYVGKQIDKIGKYTDKKFKCASIQCKRKNQGAAKFKTITRKPKIISL